jgi:hypothetical protein
MKTEGGGRREEARKSYIRPLWPFGLISSSLHRNISTNPSGPSGFFIQLFSTFRSRVVQKLPRIFLASLWLHSVVKDACLKRLHNIHPQAPRIQHIVDTSKPHSSSKVMPPCWRGSRISGHAEGLLGLEIAVAWRGKCRGLTWLPDRRKMASLPWIWIEMRSRDGEKGIGAWR